MQKYFNTILDEKGDPIQEASVLVQTSAGATATIYADNSGTTTGNPISTDENGYFEFYAPNGLYTVVASKTGKTTVTISNILLDDPTVATIAALRAAGTPTTSNARISVLGYTTAGDGGGGDFYWDSTSSDADDSLSTILPTGYAGTGRWKRNPTAPLGTATLPAGTIQGATTISNYTYTLDGHADGTGDARIFQIEPTVSGANDLVGATGVVSHVNFSGTGTVAAGAAFSGSPRVTGNGTITAASAFNGAVHLISGSGNITTGMVFQAKSQVMTGAGTITNLVGFRCHNIGHARVTNTYCFQADDQTNSPTLMIGFRSAITSGTGKWAFYDEGGANSAFLGNVRIGSNVAPTVALDVTGRIQVSGGTAAAPGIVFSSSTNTGFNSTAAGRIYISYNGSDQFRFVGDANNAFDILHASASIRLGSPVDTIIIRDAANTLALKNSTNAQEFRVYGSTTGTKYLQLKHDGTDAIVDTSASAGNLKLGPTNATDIQWGKALVALGGGAAPTLGTIGGSGPAAAAQNSWLRVLDSTGAACFIPVWK